MEPKKGNKKDYKIRAASASYNEKEIVVSDGIEYDSKSKEVKRVDYKEIEKANREKDDIER